MISEAFKTDNDSQNHKLYNNNVFIEPKCGSVNSLDEDRSN